MRVIAAGPAWRWPQNRCQSCFVCSGFVEIEFTSLAQAHAVYDVVEHRVLTVPPEALLPEPEVDEVMELVGFMLRLSPLIKNDTEE